jgi:putative CGCGG family rSAM target protein
MSHSETSDTSPDDECTAGTDHEGSWSANLEGERHAESEARVIEDAREAVAATRAGYHVNLVTHGAHGDPREYLWDALDATARPLTVEYVDRCGCGGHVTRVHVHEE